MNKPKGSVSAERFEIKSKSAIRQNARHRTRARAENAVRQQQTNLLLARESRKEENNIEKYRFGRRKVNIPWLAGKSV